MNKLNIYGLLLLTFLTCSTLKAQWFNDDVSSGGTVGTSAPVWINTGPSCNSTGVTNQGVVATALQGACTTAAGSGSFQLCNSTSYGFVASGSNIGGCSFTYTLTIAQSATISSIQFGLRRTSQGPTTISGFTIDGTSYLSSLSSTTISINCDNFTVTVSPNKVLSAGTRTIVLTCTNALCAGVNWVTRLDDFKIFGNVVLGVELKSFTATPQSNGTKLSWTTASEENSKGFDIEHSFTGKEDWKSIGFVKAKGQASSYEFIDNDPLSIAYYRLKEIDLNGKEILSKVVSVNKKNKLSVKVSPNPTSDKVLVSFNGDEGIINVYDVSGKNVSSKKVLSNQTEVDIQTLPVGIYVVELQAKGDVWREKIVKN
jgi:Secretion system C-terminal sorting domain